MHLMGMYGRVLVVMACRDGEHLTGHVQGIMPEQCANL